MKSNIQHLLYELICALTALIIIGFTTIYTQKHDALKFIIMIGTILIILFTAAIIIELIIGKKE